MSPKHGAESQKRRVRATAEGGTEQSTQRAAMFFVIVAGTLVLLNLVIRRPTLVWMAGSAAGLAVLAALLHFYERGKRATVMELAFRGTAEKWGGGETPREVKVSGDGGVQSATLAADGDQWSLTTGARTVEYDLDEAGAMEAWPDYRLLDFASQMQRRERLRLRCCGTCNHFGHSHVSRLASDGWVGYCTVKGEGLLVPERDGVHIWHLCGKWQAKE